MTTAVDARIPAGDTMAGGRRSQRTGPGRRLFAKYAAALVGLVSLVLLINGSLNVWFSYGEAKDAAIRLQREKAEATAQRIEEFIAEIEKQIGWTTATQWASSPIEQRRFDFGRLQRQVPAITELIQLDGQGHEQLKVSRLSMDVAGGGAEYSADPRFTEALANKVWFGPVYFRKESEPYMTMAVAQSGRNAGVTVAEVNLKLIWDVITAIKIGKTGYAYVVDDKGRLIAHPDISRVLRNTDLSALPQVAAARGTPAATTEPAEIERNLDGHQVLSASAAIPRLGWLVFVEQPIGEALAPLYTSLLQTGLLLLLGLVVAVLAGLLLARRMTGPIRELDAGAARIGAGALEHRITVDTGDELEELAKRFNAMAADLQSSYADLEKKVEDRTAELKESLDQQTATAEVLQVINTSPGDVRPTFDAIAASATRLCEAAMGAVFRFDGSDIHLTALYNFSPVEFDAIRRAYPLAPSRGSITGRAIMTGAVAHVADIATDPEYVLSDMVRSGMHAHLSVPMLLDGNPVGAITVGRRAAEPFSEAQIELLKTFAAQAVIAMENARLLGELRDRTHDLQESLEYQTASGDVLKVISQSGGELEQVLATLVETAARICRADSGFIFQLQGGLCRMAAAFGIPAEYKEFQERNPIAPGRGTLAGRTVLERRAVHIEDAATDPEYTRAQAVELGRQRTMLGVPLIREDALIGVITLARSDVEPFTEKQIGLVTTFADQAVIAIENGRLFNELRTRTTELGRSVEELKMLSEVGQAVSSTLDLRAVLSTILTASLGVTWANAGAIYRYSRAERAFRLVEAVGWDEALMRSVRALRIAETETAMGEAVAQRTPIQLPDLAQRASYPLRDVTLAAGFHSALIVPLVGAERILGAIVLTRQEAGEFPPETVRLMQTLASQSVLAIQNARMFREIADKSEQLALASQHKSQFLANMSHELRTPLNAILGYAELLVDGIYGVLPDRPKGVLERIQNNGRHLLALINDVLDLAKIEAGQLTLTLEDYALAEVVRSVVTATEPLATSKGLKFTAALQDDMPMGHGDARRVSQVLMNLVGNAIKFTEAGEVEIRASVAGGQFVLTVRDTGPGIADADQEQIFGEFQQIDNSNTRSKGGTGLGLAISKRMVEMQGGTILVESVLGEGSTFRVALPVHVDEMMEAAE